MRIRRTSLIVLAALAALTFAPSAGADVTFGTLGSGAGQTDGPKGLAADATDGNLYVADQNNNRIDVFDKDGNFIRAFGWGVDTGAAALQTCTTASTCQAGIAGSGAGQLSGPLGVAVDNDPASPAFQDVYVYDGSNTRVERFHPDGEFVGSFGSSGEGPGQFGEIVGIGVGPGGTVYVADTKLLESTPEGNKFKKRVHKFQASGALIETTTLTTGLIGNVQAFAVDPSGNFSVGSAAGTGVHRYGPTGTELAAFNPSFNVRALTTDPSGNVYVADVTGFSAIRRYDPAGTQLSAFGYGSVGRSGLGPGVEGIAFFHTAQSDVCTSQGPVADSKIVCFPLPPAGPIVLPEAGNTAANPVGNVRATLNAVVNPEGTATKFHFEYVDEGTYEKDVEELGPGHGFDHAIRVPEGAGEDQSAGSDFEPHKVSRMAGCLDPQNPAEVARCLAPETEYRFRAVATNTHGQSAGPEAVFTTKGAPEFQGLWSTEVGLTDAVVHATLDPLAIPTTGRFQYVDEASFLQGGFQNPGESLQVDFGAGEGASSAGAQLAGLDPGTTYHYRLFATNFAGQKPGPEQTFTTYPARPDLGGCPNEAFRTGLSAELPDCRAYEMVSPPDKEGGDIIPLLSAPDGALPAEVAQAAVDGSGLTYSSYRSFGDAVSAPYTVQYLARRQEGERWANHSISPPREGASFYPVAGLDSQYWIFSQDLCEGWLRADSEPTLASGAVAGFGNLYRHRVCGSDGYEALTTAAPASQPPEKYFPELQGTSADGTHTVFRANDALTPDASGALNSEGEPIYQLYGAFEGGVRLLSVLPGGAASALGSSAGTANGSLFRHYEITHALSADASRLYWDVSTDPLAYNPGKLYLRENPFGENATECLPADPTSPCTVAVSEAVGGPGSSGPAQFWLASADGSRAIFSFTGGPLAGNLYEFDAATGTASLIAGNVGGVVGAGEDATKLYFTSGEALAAGAVAGKENLYLHRLGGGPAFSLVATVGGQSALCPLAIADPFRVCSRVSADGNILAFVSSASLTGYDNIDAHSGEADAEVYRYDAGEGKLRCISCNPSNSRPVGLGINAFGHLNWIAARLPSAKTAFHASRSLTDGGNRLFFESFDALLPRDTNGRSDIYEWEAASGKAQCEEKKAELYVPGAGGCISLISSGQSPEETEFVDASASGDDVFFKTSQSLVGWDSGLIDIYDARSGGGLPEPPVAHPPCEGEACQGTPAPPAFKTPSSSTYRGAGNLKEGKPKAKHCAKPKRKVRRAGTVRCVGKQGKKQKHTNHRRAAR